MKYVIKCQDCVYGVDTLEDAAKIVNAEWNDFILAYEMEYADVGGGGVFYDITEKVCHAWIDHYAGDAEYAYGSLDVPRLVSLHCADDIAEIEAEIEAEEDWLGEAARDYRHSVGIHWNR